MAYLFRFSKRERSSFIERVGSFRVSLISFQKVDEVGSTTSLQCLPSTRFRGLRNQVFKLSAVNRSLHPFLSEICNNPLAKLFC